MLQFGACIVYYSDVPLLTPIGETTCFYGRMPLKMVLQDHQRDRELGGRRRTWRDCRGIDCSGSYLMCTGCSFHTGGGTRRFHHHGGSGRGLLHFCRTCDGFLHCRHLELEYGWLIAEMKNKIYRNVQIIPLHEGYFITKKSCARKITMLDVSH